MRWIAAAYKQGWGRTSADVPSRGEGFVAGVVGCGAVVADVEVVAGQTRPLGGEHGGEKPRRIFAPPWVCAKEVEQGLLLSTLIEPGEFDRWTPLGQHTLQVLLSLSKGRAELPLASAACSPRQRKPCPRQRAPTRRP